MKNKNNKVNMKKFMKMAFSVVAITAVGLGSYKAYGSYTAANMSEEDLLMAEKVDVFSESMTYMVLCCEEWSYDYISKGSIMPQCPSGTSLSSFPSAIGTIYSCGSNALYACNKFKKFGYCYVAYKK